MAPPRPPLVVVETVAARDATLAEVEGAGWRIGSGGETPTGEVWSVAAPGPVEATAAVLAAVRGCGLVVLAPREVAADLAEDLRRVGPVLYRDQTTPSLDVSGWAMLHAVARGHTVESAARMLHLSVRTAQRRLSAGQRQLGAASLAAAVARLVDPDRIAAAP